MAKNSIYYTSLPEEESFSHHSHTTANTSMHFQDFATNSFQFQGSPAESSRATSPTQSHRQAEKRRRDRINAQLARLRKLIPKSDKMDKAALLERVVDEIKDLKTNATEISKFLTVPTETDDITIECGNNILEQLAIPQENINKNEMLIKVSFCCEDRSDLISDLIRALKSLNLTTVGADFASLGGRIKTILILYYKDNNSISGDIKEGFCNFSAIKQSIMAVLTRLISWSNTSNNFRVTSKRQRFFFSS